MKTRSRIGLTLLTAGVATCAIAADAVNAVGPETRAWLDFQTGGTAASTVERPMAGEVADRVYQRYADSFAVPIPETFERERFIPSGGSN